MTYYLLQYKDKFSDEWKQSLFSSYEKAEEYRAFLRYDTRESHIISLILDEDEL